MNIQFNGIYTGYVSGEAQIHKIFTFLDTFYKPDHNFLLVDPVMGDHGKTYGMYTDQLRARMRELVFRADLTTPNLTELCLLADIDFYSLPSADESSKLFAAIEEMCRKLCKQGTKSSGCYRNTLFKRRRWFSPHWKPVYCRGCAAPGFFP